MFCPECGTEVAESAGFCRKCGAPLRDDAVRPVQAAQAAAPAPSGAVAAVRAAGAGVGQPVVGVVAIIGAAIALLGCILPWLDYAGSTSSSFDIGFLTSSKGDGNDGIIILIMAIAAAALSITYFRRPNQLAGLGVLVLGVAIAGVAGYDMVKIISKLNEFDMGSPTKYLGMGMYASIAGGVIVVGAAFFGFKQGMAARR